MSKKIIGKNLSEVSLPENLPEKLKSMNMEDAFRARSARKRHSIQLDKRISAQLQERRSSNASSTSEGGDSVCKWIMGATVCKFGGDTDNCFISGAVAVLCYHLHVCIDY